MDSLAKSMSKYSNPSFSMTGALPVIIVDGVADLVGIKEGVVTEGVTETEESVEVEVETVDMVVTKGPVEPAVTVDLTKNKGVKVVVLNWWCQNEQLIW